MNIRDNDIIKTFKVITEDGEKLFDDELDLIFDILNDVVHGRCFLVYEMLCFTVENRIYEYSYDISNRFIRMFREFIFQNILDREFKRIIKEAS